jgi:hypothetical protein
VTVETRVAALRAEADRLESTSCTGLTATWCPVHGDCRCPHVYYADGDEPQGRTLNDPACPLHAVSSSHAEAGVA